MNTKQLNFNIVTVITAYFLTTVLLYNYYKNYNDIVMTTIQNMHDYLNVL